MSTPETPPSTTPTPDASVGATTPQPPAEGAPAHAEPTSNGHAPEVPAGEPVVASGDASSDASEGGAPAEKVEAHGEQHGEQGEKKRRRRRRRKKGGAAAPGEAVAAEGADEAGSDQTAEGAQGAAGETTERREHEKKRDKKPQKKSAPRERPPTNAGDIVFGKILAITDEAIIVDIPGKAHAIFDRREMLLPDEDETAGPHRAPAAEPPAAPQEADASTPAEAQEGQAEAAAEVVTPPAAEPSVEPSVQAEAAPVTVVSGEAASAEEPPREPKVPRVVLEVGADFIAVVHNDGARGGLVVLTHHPHRAEKAKALVEKAFNEKTTILGLVTGVIKGGVEVDVDGLRAFAPGSHVDLRLGADLSHLVAERLPFHVTEYAKRGRDVVLTRRSMLEEEAKKARSEALTRLKVGEEIEGTVRSVVQFGAFVDVGGIEGLVPLQEMSHNRADGPGDVFKAGETTRVKVTKIDERGKVWLSRKATIPDPWQAVAQKYAAGTRHPGKVARLQPFGAFIELEPGVDGLIHAQDLSLKRIEDPSEVVKVGDALEVVVAHVDPGLRKIALHPALQGDATAEAPQKVTPHKPVKAKVVTIESGGLLVRVLGVTGRHARGYVTAAATGTQRGTELRKVFKVDQEIEAKVIEIDPRRGEVRLSIKALSEDQERNAYQQYRHQLKAEARFTFGDLLAKKGNPPQR